MDAPRAAAHELAAMAATALARLSLAPALEFQSRSYGWDELRQVADSVEAALTRSGIAAHAPVVFLPRNRPSAAAALLGLVAASRNIRMAYPFQSPASLARDLQNLKPAAVIAASEDFAPELLTQLQAQGVAAIALTEMNAQQVSRPNAARNPSANAAASEPQIEILTSGTTGTPKPFAISYSTIFRHYISGTQSEAQAAAAAQTAPVLLFFPFSNISGIYTTLPTLLKGRPAILLDRFSIAAWHEYVLRYRPTVGGLPPAGVQMLLDADIPPADLASLRSVGTGAAPLDPTVQRAFEERYGIPILQSYGATEFVGPVTAMTLPMHAQWGREKFGSCGRAMAGAQLRVVAAETGAVLPPGVEGLLEVISPRVGPDWIKTHDIAMIDSDGFLFHRGRADDVIVRGGFKLLPEAIERALLLHTAVSAAAVTGVNDRRLGQVPAAAVQFKHGATLTVPELERHLRDHVPATHIPVHWRIVAELPRTPSLKVDRPALRALFDA